MTEELKTCQCGSKVEMYQKGQYEMVIHCPGCTMKIVQRSLHYPLEQIGERMIKSWNTRPLEDALRKQLDSMENNNRIFQHRGDKLQAELDVAINKLHIINNAFYGIDAGILKEVAGQALAEIAKIEKESGYKNETV